MLSVNMRTYIGDCLAFQDLRGAGCPWNSTQLCRLWFTAQKYCMLGPYNNSAIEVNLKLQLWLIKPQNYNFVIGSTNGHLLFINFYQQSAETQTTATAMGSKR